MMSDFDYENYQKKRIASGDRHRKRGSKSKYCGLPSDHLSQAQWKKRNGEVKVMNLNQPMVWAEFKLMPDDLQKEYIQKCVERFGMSMKDFGEIFGVSVPTLRGRLNELHLCGLFQSGRRKTKEQVLAYAGWTANGDSGSLCHSEAAQTPALCQRLDMTWSGAVNLAEVLQLVYQFTNGNSIKLRVIAEKI